MLDVFAVELTGKKVTTEAHRAFHFTTRTRKRDKYGIASVGAGQYHAVAQKRRFLRRVARVVAIVRHNTRRTPDGAKALAFRVMPFIPAFVRNAHGICIENGRFALTAVEDKLVFFAEALALRPARGIIPQDIRLHCKPHLTDDLHKVGYLVYVLLVAIKHPPPRGARGHIP